jgi:hypothetical protein
MWNYCYRIRPSSPSYNNPHSSLVGDGGAKTGRGSFGAVAALNSTRILHSKGPVKGSDPPSYRSEAYAMTSIVPALVVFFQMSPAPLPLVTPIELCSDNEGLVKKLNQMLEWRTLYPPVPSSLNGTSCPSCYITYPSSPPPPPSGMLKAIKMTLSPSTPFPSQPNSTLMRTPSQLKPSWLSPHPFL